MIPDLPADVYFAAADAIVRWTSEIVMTLAAAVIGLGHLAWNVVEGAS